MSPQACYRVPGTVISNTGFSALLDFSANEKIYFMHTYPLVKLLPFFPSKQGKKDSSDGHTVRI